MSRGIQEELVARGSRNVGVLGERTAGQGGGDRGGRKEEGERSRRARKGRLLAKSH